MFRLRQSTRRRICRAGFVLCCLAPTAALCGWGGYRHSGLYVDSQAHAWRQTLGLHVRFASIRHPRPGVVQFHGVELSEPDTGKQLATCALVQGRRSFSGAADELTCHDLVVRDGAIGKAKLLVQRILHSDVAESAADVNLTIDAARIESAREDYVFARVGGSLRGRASEASRELRLSLLPAAHAVATSESDKTADRILVRAARQAQGAVARDQWELHTGNLAVPRAWLVALSTEMPGGEETCFQGSIWSRATSAGWQAAVRGRFTEVDLAELLTSRFGHHASGRVMIDLDPAQIQSGRLVEVRGRLRGASGEIEGAFLGSLARALGCAMDRELAEQLAVDPAAAQPFGEVAFQFAIDAQGLLTMSGECADKPGVMLTSTAGAPLVAQPARQPLSDVALVDALAGAEGPRVAATPQAAHLLSLLPLAEPATPQHTTASRTSPAAPRATSAPAAKRRF